MSGCSTNSLPVALSLAAACAPNSLPVALPSGCTPNSLPVALSLAAVNLTPQLPVVLPRAVVDLLNCLPLENSKSNLFCAYTLI